MSAITNHHEDLVFGLDIGTRSIVGTVGYRDKNKFNVVAMSVKFHESRSMIDGQIHDIVQVSKTISEVKEELEAKLEGVKLSEVCIAAAGRVLRTEVGRGEFSFNESTKINQEHIHSIDLIGIEDAHDKLRKELEDEDETTKFYCVGYTVIKYYLNDIEISNLEGHKGSHIAADVLATFLPEEVVTSLYSAVEMAGLYVANLTLEPIAAINVAIPERYRMLNIALIDIGAGTSDICITNDGSIIGYGMIPSAGDELTEILVKKYLIDFDTAEMLKTVDPAKKQISYKDIMGIAHKITPAEIMQNLEEAKAQIAGKIAEKIIELNGGETVSAAFVVGGGGKLEGFIKLLSEGLSLPEERVALRGAEVMNDINFEVENFKKDALYVTPIGICLSYYDSKNNFIFAIVNGERVKLYNNDKLTVFDAALAYGLTNEDLFPKRGADVTFKINGKTRIVRGTQGEAAVIQKNGEDAGMNTHIEADDVISITPSTVGEDAHPVISSLPEYDGKLTFTVNGDQAEYPKFAVVGNLPVLESYEIKDGDRIEMQSFYTVRQLLTYMDISGVDSVQVNHQDATLDTKIFNNFTVDFTYGDRMITTDETVPEETEDVRETEETPAIVKPEKKPEVSSPPSPAAEEKKADDEKADTATDLTIILNKKPLTLTGKPEYRFVDIFDFFDFDLTTVQGKHLVTDVDGHKADYTELLSEGAVVDIFWEK